MAISRGRNRAGLTGLIDLPGLGSGVKFYADIYRWQTRMEGQARPRRGRSGNQYTAYRWTFSSGVGSASGKVQTDGWPAPDAWKGQTGTITVQVDSSKTVAYPILVTAAELSFNVEKDDLPRVSFSWQLTGAPTYTGWTGTQPAATDPSKSDLQLWEGTVFSFDPSLIADHNVLVIDWWGTVTDSDTGDIGKLSTKLTAATAPTNTPEKRPSFIRRDAPDGGTIELHFGRTNTAQDIENPRTDINVDQSSIGQVDGSARLTQVEYGGEDAPSTPSGMLLRFKDTNPINSGANAVTYVFGVRTPQQDIEFLQSSRTRDQSAHLRDGAMVVQVTDSATPVADPSTLNPDSTNLSGSGVPTSHQLTDSGLYVHAYEFRPFSTKESVEKGGTIQHDDTVGKFVSDDEVTVLDTSSAAGTAPVRTKEGRTLVCTDVITKQVSKTEYSHHYLYDYRSRPDQLVASRTSDQTDPHSLEDEVFTAQVYSGTPADLTSPRDSLVLDWKKDFSTPNPDYTLRVYRWARATSITRRTAPHISTTTDSNNISDRAFRCEVVATGAASSDPTDAPTNNVMLIDTTDVAIPENPGYSLRIWMYGPADSADQKLLEFYKDVVDASGLQSHQIRAKLDTSGSDPGADSISGYSQRFTHTIKLSLSLDTNRTVYVYEYGLTTTQQDVEFRSTRYVTSPEDPDGFGRQLTEVASVIDTTTPSGARDDALSANQTIAGFMGAAVIPLTAGKALKIITTTGETLILRKYPGRVIETMVRGIPSGGWSGSGTGEGSGTLQPGNVTRSDTDAIMYVKALGAGQPSPGYLTTVFAEPFPIWRAKMRFSIERVVNEDYLKDPRDDTRYDDTPSLATFDDENLSIRGQVNDDWFCGHAAGEVMFQGTSYDYCWDITGSRRVRLTQWFETDNWKWFGFAGLPLGTIYPPTTDVHDTGFYKASLLVSSALMTFPQTTSFLGFLGLT